MKIDLLFAVDLLKRIFGPKAVDKAARTAFLYRCAACNGFGVFFFPKGQKPKTAKCPVCGGDGLK